MRIAYALPLALFALLAVALGVGLSLKPNEIPSALIGEPVPDFELPPLYEDGRGLSAAALSGGGPVLLNVFASWCPPCRVEHDQLMALQAGGFAVYGLNYKDRPEDARRFLAELGDPYDRIGVDRSGRVGIEFGVYGVPETFVISPAGRITYKHIGPVMPQDLARIRREYAAAKEVTS